MSVSIERPGVRLVLQHRALPGTPFGRSDARRVMEKSGLSLIRTFHQAWSDPIAGAEHGEVEYALLKEEWEQQRAHADEQAWNADDVAVHEQEGG